MFEVISNAADYPLIARSQNKLSDFSKLILSLRKSLEEKEMSEFFDDVITKTGYMASLELDKETCDERKANVMELLANLLHYMEDNDDATLTGFLEEVALMTDIDNYNSESDSAVMMTLHSAKGLEFPVVFIVGMEEGLFPGNQVMYDESEVEEERRLCYVGITRAKEKLYITNARSRMIFGNTSFTRPSRFIGEIPPELTDSDFEKRSGYNSFWGADLNDYAPAAPYSQRKKTADSTAFAQKKSSYSPPERNKGFSRGFSGKGAGSTTATGTVDLKAGDSVAQSVRRGNGNFGKAHGRRFAFGGRL